MKQTEEGGGLCSYRKFNLMPDHPLPGCLATVARRQAGASARRKVAEHPRGDGGQVVTLHQSDIDRLRRRFLFL